MGVRARDMVRRYFDHLLKVAARNADQAGVVRIVRQALAVMGKRVEQLAECRCDRLLVRQTVEHRALTASGVGTPSRHVGRLIPIQYVARRGQIADLAQAPLELNQLLLGRASVARRLGRKDPLSGCWVCASLRWPGRVIRVYAGFRLRIISEIAPALVRPLGAEIVVALRNVVCQRHQSAIAPFLPLGKILPRQATAALRLNPVQELA